jgi:hypothetical protein
MLFVEYPDGTRTVTLKVRVVSLVTWTISRVSDWLRGPYHHIPGVRFVTCWPYWLSSIGAFDYTPCAGLSLPGMSDWLRGSYGASSIEPPVFCWLRKMT